MFKRDIETNNYYTPLNQVDQSNQCDNNSRKATSPIDEQVNTKKQRQYGAYNAHLSQTTVNESMDTENVIDPDPQLNTDCVNDVSDTLSSARQVMDDGDVTQTVDATGGPDYV